MKPNAKCHFWIHLQVRCMHLYVDWVNMFFWSTYVVYVLYIESLLSCVCVLQLIRCRNDLMHSPDQHVKEEWMEKFKVVLQRFVQLFSKVPSMALAEARLAQVSVSVRVCAAL